MWQTILNATLGMPLDACSSTFLQEQFAHASSYMYLMRLSLSRLLIVLYNRHGAKSTDIMRLSLSLWLIVISNRHGAKSTDIMKLFLSFNEHGAKSTDMNKVSDFASSSHIT